MRRLLIEDIASANGQNPAMLNPIEIRKLCILIDWALTLKTFQEDISYTPYLKKIELTDNEFFNLRDGLIIALREDGFKEFEQASPNCEALDNMFKRLCPYLGFDPKCVDRIHTGFVGDYLQAFNRKGLVHSDSLSLSLSHQESQILVEENQRIAKANPGFYGFNTLQFKGNCVEIQFMAEWFNQASAANNIDFALLLSLMMREATVFCSLNRKMLSQHNMQTLIGQLNTLLVSLPLTHDLPKLKQIELNLMDTIAHAREEFALHLKRTLAALLMRVPQIRGWHTYESVSKQARIDRVILMGMEDVVDDEVMRTANLMQLKHPTENIVMTFLPQDVYQVNQHNMAFDNKYFTLQTIGHGAVHLSSEIYANLGAYRGLAQQTGNFIAELVNGCPNITHLRLSCCFGGLMADNADISYMVTKQPKTTIYDLDKTLTMSTDSDLLPNQPFLEKSAALVCWNHMRKGGRSFKMSVSPGIIEPDESISKMVWKPSVVSQAHAHIKEVRVQTRLWKK